MQNYWCQYIGVFWEPINNEYKNYLWRTDCCENVPFYCLLFVLQWGPPKRREQKFANHISDIGLLQTKKKTQNHKRIVQLFIFHTSIGHTTYFIV